MKYSRRFGPGIVLVFCFGLMGVGTSVAVAQVAPSAGTGNADAPPVLSLRSRYLADRPAIRAGLAISQTGRRSAELLLDTRKAAYLGICSKLIRSPQSYRAAGCVLPNELDLTRLDTPNSDRSALQTQRLYGSAHLLAFSLIDGYDEKLGYLQVRVPSAGAVSLKDEELGIDVVSAGVNDLARVRAALAFNPGGVLPVELEGEVGLGWRFINARQSVRIRNSMGEWVRQNQIQHDDLKGCVAIKPSDGSSTRMSYCRAFDRTILDESGVTSMRELSSASISTRIKKLDVGVAYERVTDDLRQSTDPRRERSVEVSPMSRSSQRVRVSLGAF